MQNQVSDVIQEPPAIHMGAACAAAFAVLVSSEWLTLLFIAFVVRGDA